MKRMCSRAELPSAAALPLKGFIEMREEHSTGRFDIRASTPRSQQRPNSSLKQRPNSRPRYRASLFSLPCGQLTVLA